MMINLGKDLYLKGRIGWRGLCKDEYLADSDYRIINATALKDGYVEWDNCGYISKQRYEESPEIMLKEGDILISKDGTLGKIGYVKNMSLPCTVASGIFVLRNTIPDIIDFDYLYHVLKSDIFKDFINRNKAQGSTILHLYQRDLENFHLELPNIREQRKIAEVLNVLEEKISINNEINTELEAMIKTIYDYWFLQFEFPDENGKPYKSSDGKMVWNEELKREIPEGLDVENMIVNSLCKPIKTGINYFEKKNYLPTANVNFEEITDGDFITFDNRESRANMQPSINSVWFAKMKNSVKHISIPKNGQWFVDRYILSTGFEGLQCRDSSFAYIHELVASLYFEKHKNILSHGATQESVNDDDLKNIKFVVPSEKVLMSFADRINPMLEIKFSNIKENKELASLRDWLLPMLMNGQVTFE